MKELTLKIETQITNCMKKSEQKEYFLKLADIIRQTGASYAKLIGEEGKEDDLISQILDFESQGDDYQDKLDGHFKEQKNIPYLALDRAKLLARMDEVLDDLALAARTYGAYGSALPDDFPAKIKNFADDIVKISDKFSTAVETIYSSFADALVLCSEIEKLRDEMMSLTFEMERDYFESSDNWKSFIAIEQIMRKSMKAVAQIKQASEILELMAMKYD